MPEDPRLKEILSKIEDLFGDTSVPKEKTVEWMEEISSAADGMAEVVKGDIEREEGA